MNQKNSMDRKKLSVEKICFYTGMVGGIAAACTAAILCINHWDLQVNFTPCFLYSFFGMYCPGCGGTRALNSLLHGRMIESFFYHPLVLYVALYYVWFMGTYLWYIIVRKEKYTWPLGKQWLTGALIVVLLQWILKLLFI